MIKMNQIIGKTMINKVIETGTGDIEVTGLEHEEEGWVALAFIQDKPKKIGTEDNSIIGKTIDEIVPDTIIKFDNLESIDVVIRQLKKTRKLLINLKK